MKKLIPPDANLIPSNATRVYEGELFDVYQWKQEMFDGSFCTYENLRRTDSVIIIGIVDDKIIITEDHQPHKGMTVGFPGGRVDSGDVSTLAAAQREMREETGYEFADWRLVDVIKPLAKMEYFMHVYLAQQPTAHGKADIDPGGERIDLILCNLDSAREKLKESYHSAIEYMFLEKIKSMNDLIFLPEFDGLLVDISVK